MRSILSSLRCAALKNVPKRVFDKSDALLWGVDLVRFLLVEGYVAVPNVSFVLRGPLLHICKLFLRDHALSVKNTRRFLQVFEDGRVPLSGWNRRAVFRWRTRDLFLCVLCIRCFVLSRHVIEDSLSFGRHIIECAVVRMARALLFRCIPRRPVWRVLQIKYDGLVTDHSYSSLPTWRSISVLPPLAWRGNQA